jgi:hypothetical protein
MIDRFCVFGERCSGTTYLENLIESNFGLPKTEEFGLKHMWDLTDFSGSDTTLFIGIERELLEWLDSFAKTPHQVKPYCPLEYDKLFFEPIRSYMGQRLVEEYENIMECRTEKGNLIHFLFPNILKHYYFIKYEDLVADPISFLKTIQEKYNLVPKLVPFQNWNTYKNDKELYKKKDLTIPKEIVELLYKYYPKHFLKRDENYKRVHHSSILYSC